MGSQGPRWFIYLPKADSSTFVFFYYDEVPTGRSWSLRKWVNGREIKRMASEFPWTDKEVLRLATHKFQTSERRDAKKQVAWYERRIRELNFKYLGSKT